MPRGPHISVVIPTYNGADRIRACLSALRAQQTDYGFEVIVVDDGSTDGAAALLEREPGVRLVRQQNAGPSAARNHGAEVAQGDLIFFTDDDCVPEADWIQELAGPFLDPEISGAKGAYFTRQRRLTARFVQLEYEEKYDNLARHRFIDFIDTYSAAFRRSVFLAAGGYDLSFPTASVEDQEFSFRLANAGEKMVFAPGARVWHSHVDSPLGYFRKKKKIGYWKVLALVKNPNKAAGDAHTPLSLKLQVGLGLLFWPSLGLGLLGPAGALVPSGLAAALLGTAVPLTVRCLRADPLVGAVAPALISLRALGLSLGLIQGTMDRLLGRTPR